MLLFPAAVLIMVALAGMTVDSAISFLAQRELVAATAAAANDAATLAVSDRAFYQGDRIELSPAVVEAVAVDRVFRLVDQRRHHGLAVRADAVAPAGPGCAWTVRVLATSSVDELFGAVLPGSTGRADVRAQSTASPRRGTTPC